MSVKIGSEAAMYVKIGSEAAMLVKIVRTVNNAVKSAGREGSSSDSQM